MQCLPHILCMPHHHKLDSFKREEPRQNEDKNDIN